MKIRSILSLRRLAFVGATLLLLAVAPGRGHAAFVLTLTQAGGNVVVNGSGTVNTTSLTLSGNNIVESARIYTSLGLIFAGPTALTAGYLYTGGGLTGPASFGTGGFTNASSGTGSSVGIDIADTNIFVPQGYVSGTFLTDSNTYSGATFASLGFTPGTYVYTWGTGANADSLTVTSVVPEPSTWVLSIAGGVSLLGVAYRRRQA